MFLESQNFSIVQTELDSVFYQEFDYPNATPGRATAETGEIFKPLNTTHAAYIESVFKGVGLFPNVGEVQTVPNGTPRVTNKFTVNILDWAQNIELSKNLFDDNMHGVWSRSVQDLALKARITMDQNAFKVFRNAFTTQLTADGVSFINAAHPLIGGGTESNLVTGALSQGTLNDAIVRLAQQKDQAGVVLGNQPAILLVPTPLFKKAIEITESALISGSANNDINVYRSAFGITVYTSPYLDAVNGGSDTAWFLLSRNHSVTRYIRQGIETALRDWSVSNNRTYLYQCNFREEVSVIDYVGAIGALGT
jgi:hypothetical protein